MRFLTCVLFLLFSFVATAQDSCIYFGSSSIYQPRMMGYTPGPIEWQEIDCVYHIHYTDSFPNSYISDDIVLAAHDHLNEEFSEAMMTFELITIIHHDFDQFWASPDILEQNNICLPSSMTGWERMEDYVETIVWDREIYMNVHVFPTFCGGVLGFAWTAHSSSTDLDGVWVRTDVFGDYGPQLSNPTRSGNKTLIHEVGHFVSLHHVFRNIDYCGEDLGDCLETGDFVCDTPPTKLNWSCVNPICPTGAYNYEVNNHMDYYVDSCRTNFTPGQIERIHAALPILRPGITDQPPYCLGDINGDHVVGSSDLMLMLSNFNDVSWLEGDLNGNGFFNVIDFSILLSRWGEICYGAELDPFYREEQLKMPKKERGLSPFLDLR